MPTFRILRLHHPTHWPLLQVKETVRDVHFLHNEQFFAAAQKKYVYIYDKRGLEVHCLRVKLGRMFKECCMLREQSQRGSALSQWRATLMHEQCNA